MTTRLVTTHDILDGHVTLDIECLDRLPQRLVPNLQVAVSGQYLAARGYRSRSPAVVNRIGERFRKAVRRSPIATYSGGEVSRRRPEVT